MTTSFGMRGCWLPANKPSVTDLTMYSAELHSGILAASLPSLRPMFRKILDHTSRQCRTGEGPSSQYGIRSTGVRASRNGYLKQDDISLKNLEQWPAGRGFGETAVSCSTRPGVACPPADGVSLVPQNAIMKRTEVCVHEQRE